MCFESVVDLRKTLVLTDFGLSSLHKVDTAQRRHPTEVGAVTLVYRAPESDMKDESRRATSRSYDIWSLGCVFLEMAAWILGDLRGLEMARMNKGVEEPFFEAQQTVDGKYLFSIKKSVTEVR